MTITRKIKIGKIWKLVILSIQPISDLPCKLKKKKTFFFDFFYLKLSAIGWIESRTKFQNSPIFIFRVIAKFHRKLGWWRHKNDQKITLTRKIKIGKIWNLVFRSIQPILNLSCRYYLKNYLNEKYYRKFWWNIK